MRPPLSPSLWRRPTLAGIAIADLMLLFNTNIFDSLEVAPPGDSLVPVASTLLPLHANRVLLGYDNGFRNPYPKQNRRHRVTPLQCLRRRDSRVLPVGNVVTGARLR